MLTERTTYLKSLQWKEEIGHLPIFPYQLPIFRQLEQFEFHPNVTFIVGENGIGKSTFIETIATLYGFNPEGGTRNFQFSNYDSHVEMHDDLRLVKSAYRPDEHFFLRAESFYNVATEIERLDQEGTGQVLLIHSAGSPCTSNHMGKLFSPYLMKS